MTIKEIAKKHAEFEASQKAAEEKLEALQKQRKEIQQQLSDAIDAEDGSAILRLKRKDDELEPEFMIMRNRLWKKFPISADDLAGAWTDYTETFEAKKDKLSKAIDADLEKLGADMRALSDLQRDAFEARNYLVEVGHLDPGVKKSRFPLRLYLIPKINTYNGSVLLGIAINGHEQERDQILSGYSLIE